MLLDVIEYHVIIEYGDIELVVELLVEMLLVDELADV